MLIVINPSGKDAEFAYGGTLGEVLYQNGGDMELKDGKLRIPGATAVFVKEVK